MWDHPVEDCDVHDYTKLIRYRERAETWVSVLSGDPLNSVSAQLIDMFWNDAVWRSLNESRRLAIDREGIGTPGIVAALLDRGYLTGQVLSVSRLLERSSRNATKQVNSLRRIADELSAERGLFTREVFVAHDGLPFDWEAVRERVGFQAGVVWRDTAGPNAWEMALLRHKEFDRLSGVSSGQRSRNDLISDHLWQKFEQTLNDPVFEDILAFRHKSIAHAADEFSRSAAPNLRLGVSLNEFARAHYLLLGLYQAISANLLYQSWLGSAVPVPQVDQFEDLDLRLLEDDARPSMKEFWDDHCSEREGWLTSAYYEIIPRKD